MLQLTSTKSNRCGRRQACGNCKRRKERCDGRRPCGRCCVRRVEQECSAQDTRRGSTPHDTSYSLSSTVNNDEDVDHGHMQDHPEKMTENRHATNPPVGIHDLASSISPLEPRVAQNYRFCRNRNGEYIFVGQSSNLSVLHSLRQLVSSCLGSCPFVDEPAESDLVEDEPFESIDWGRGTVKPQLPCEEDARYCIRWYASATNCVFDLFSQEELVSDIIPWLTDKSPSATSSCINFLVLAIGAQCGPQDREVDADSYFSYGRYLAMSQFLQAPRIATVQVYALLTMYLLNSSRPNSANMHLGVAVRTAYALGVHRSDISALFSSTEEAYRERMWKVLRVLDLFLSTTLGHRNSTSETRDTACQQEYSPSNDLCNIFEKIVSEIYVKEEEPSSVLQRVSKHHREWAAHFHEGLRVDHISADEYIAAESGSKQLNIGLYHLKEAYYWTIMLISRPYLLELVRTNILNLNNPLQHPATEGLNTTLLPQTDTLLAHASVNSAVLTINLLRGLLRANEIPKRLPFVVNSIFASALVLGASFFANLDWMFPVGEALLTAERLLGLFQQHDLLAKRALEVVRSFRCACSEFVKRRHERWLRHQSILVEGLFGDIKSRYPDFKGSTDGPFSLCNATLRREGREPSPAPSLPTESSRSSQMAEDFQIVGHEMWDNLFRDDLSMQLGGSESLGESSIQQLDTNEVPDFRSLMSFLPLNSSRASYDPSASNCEVGLRSI